MEKLPEELKPEKSQVFEPKEHKDGIQIPKKSKKRKKIIIFLIIATMLIGGGIGGYFGIFKPWAIKTAARYLNDGNNYLQNKEYSQALWSYQKAAALNSRNSEIHIKMGELYNLKGDSENAIIEFKKIIKLDERNFKALFYLGQIYYIQKEYDQAEDYLKKAKDIDNENIEVLNYLGQTYIAKNHFYLAEEQFEKIIQKNQNQTAYYHLAIIYADQKKYEKAKEMIEEALEINKENDLSQQAQKFSEIIDRLSASGNEAYKLTALGQFYNEIDLPSLAKSKLEEAINQVSDYRDAWVFLGHSEYLLGNYQKAEENLNKALEFDPNNNVTHYLIAKTYIKKEELDKAIDSFNKAYDLGYDNLQIKKELGELYIQKEDFLNAADQYQKAIELNPDDLEIYKKLIWLYCEKLDQADEAVELAETLIESNSSEALSYSLLAQAKISANKLNEAKEEIEKAQDINPYLDSAYYYLGIIYQKEGNKERAKENFQKAIDYDTNGDFASKAYEKIKKLE